jgi:hypothetical protein
VQGADSLFVLAEISIGLAGFTGITAALYARGTWHPHDTWRTVSLLVMSFGALAFALTPYALLSVGVADPPVWRISSAAFVVYALIGGIAAVRFQPPDAWSVPSHRPIGVIMWAVSTLNTIAQLLNALGLFPTPFGVYYIGLVILLLLGGFQFAVLILIRPS